jgi:succinyl-diaminopimelate desuccinylase
VAITDPIALAQALIREESVTPDRGGALRLVADHLLALGFKVDVVRFAEGGSPEVPNLYARLGDKAPNFCFAGHTDVVPVGDVASWSTDPFAAEVREGRLYGRGAADMKGAIAAFLVATERYKDEVGELPGSISLLLTGDEEGPAINGTKPMLQRLHDQGEKLDLCLVGEPTNPLALGEMVKIGRRGSLHGVVRVLGGQGHVAYPHLADNPVPKLLKLLLALTEQLFDEGNEQFERSNLEVLDVFVGNDADNVIPALARGRFNIRFNTEHTPASLMDEIRRRCDAVGVPYEIDFRLSGDAFLTPPGFLSECVAGAVEATLGRRPALCTSGGTSDARFIKAYCPVVEFGLVGATMHKLDEHVAVEDVQALTDIYVEVLRRVFAPTGSP